MRVLILGGNGVGNRLWVEGLSNELNEEGLEFVSVSYRHWEKDLPMIDLKVESEAVSRHVTSGDFIFVSKSAGILVALQAIRDYGVKSIKNIFIGTPIDWAKSNDIDLSELLMSVNSPTLFVQQSNDPFGSPQILRKLLDTTGLLKSEIVEVEGNDHSYTDFKALKKIINNFLKK